MIKMDDIFEGINKTTLGPQKKSRVVTEFDKRIVAYHEAGHAIVGYAQPYCDPIHEVSIIPRGRAEGYVSYRPDNDNRFITHTKMLARLATSMGGRAAEELVIKDFCSGSAGDIKYVTSIAKTMVTELGMSAMGPIYYGSDQEVFLGRSYGAAHSYSESMGGRIDAEIEGIVDAAYKKAKEILTQHREKLDTMARVLIECETIYLDEVTMIMEGVPAQEVLEKIKKKYADAAKAAQAEERIEEKFGSSTI